MEIKILTNTLNAIWPMLVIFFVVLVMMRFTYLKVNHEKFIFYKEFMNLLFIFYAMLLFQLLTDTELNKTSGINIIPFVEIMRYKIGTPNFSLNVIGNILIFLPFGYFVSNYVKASKISHILFISVITSFTVELVQHYISLNAIAKHLPRFFRSELFYNIICLIFLILFGFYFSKIIGLGWF